MAVKSLEIVPDSGNSGDAFVRLPEPVRLYIDETIDRLAKKRFPCDPIVPTTFSNIASIVSSAYKRHGNVIDLALRIRLQSLGLVVWQEPRFLVSVAADRLCDSDANCSADLEYGESFRKIQVDVIVAYFRGTLHAYECKRGFGRNDAGKIRSILRDLRCTQMLLRSYGRSRDVVADNAEAKAIFYYGTSYGGIGAKWGLTRDGLDEHFGFEVVPWIEAANDYFKTRLAALLKQLTIPGQSE